LANSKKLFNKINQQENGGCKMKRFVAVVLALALTLVCAGCSSQTSTSTSSPSASQPASPAASPEAAGSEQDTQEYTIGVSLMTLEHVFFQQIRDGLEAAAQQLGVKLNIMDASSKVDLQYTQVQDFITQKVDAIIIAPVSASGTSTMIELAEEAGIPVFSIDTRSDGEVISHIATDNYTGGRFAGQWVMENLLPDGGKMVIVSMPGSESCIMRESGFTDYLTENGSKIEILGSQTGNGDAGTALSVMQDFITLYGDEIDAVFSVTDGMAIGAMSAIQDANLDISIIGFGANPQGCAAIAEGGVFKASVRQDPDAISYTALECIVKHLNGESLENEYLIPPMVVDATNVADYL